jgi:hypothetical protein
MTSCKFEKRHYKRLNIPSEGNLKLQFHFYVTFFRDANNFVNHDEHIHHPLLPAMPDYEDDLPADQPHRPKEPLFVTESANCTEYK